METRFDMVGDLSSRNPSEVDGRIMLDGVIWRDGFDWRYSSSHSLFVAVISYDRFDVSTVNRFIGNCRPCELYPGRLHFAWSILWVPNQKLKNHATAKVESQVTNITQFYQNLLIGRESRFGFFHSGIIRCQHLQAMNFSMQLSIFDLQPYRMWIESKSGSLLSTSNDFSRVVSPPLQCAVDGRSFSWHISCWRMEILRFSSKSLLFSSRRRS